MGSEGYQSGLFLGTAPLKSAQRTRVTVGDTATLLPATALPNRKIVWVFNPSGGGKTLYVAPSSDVDTDDAEIFPGASVPFALEDGQSLYGIVASGTLDVNVWEGTP